jgi:hypothetical protein
VVLLVEMGGPNCARGATTGGVYPRRLGDLWPNTHLSRAEPKSGNEATSRFQECVVIWKRHRTLEEVPHFPPSRTKLSDKKEL